MWQFDNVSTMDCKVIKGIGIYLHILHTDFKSSDIIELSNYQIVELYRIPHHMMKLLPVHLSGFGVVDHLFSFGDETEALRYQ